MLKNNFKKSLLSLLAGMAVTVSVAAATPGIIVIDTDGSRTEFSLTSLDRITLGSTQMTVQTKNSQDSRQYPYSSVDRIMLNQPVSSLQSLTAGGKIAVWPTVTESLINISGAAAGSPVSVYGVDGSLITTAVTVDEVTVVDITAARPGVCVITVGGQSIKIIKK